MSLFVLKFVSANLKLPARSTVQEEGVNHASPSEADPLSGETPDFTDTMLYFVDPSGKTADFTDTMLYFAAPSGKTADFTDHSERSGDGMPPGAGGEADWGSDYSCRFYIRKKPPGQCLEGF